MIFRSPDGMSALQFIEIPQELHDAYEKAKDAELGQVRPFIDKVVIMVKDHEAKMEELREEMLSQFAEEKAELQRQFEEKLEQIQEEHERELFLSAEITERATQVENVVDDRPVDVVRGYKLPELTQLEVVQKDPLQNYPSLV